MHLVTARKRFRNTSAAPDAFLKEVVRFATPAGTGPVKIWFKRGKSRRFRVCSWSDESYVSARIPPPYAFQKPDKVWGGACTWEEAVVALVANATRSIWQWTNPNGRRVWGARGRLSGSESDAYATRKVREWRRTMPERRDARIKPAPTPVPPPEAPVFLRRRFNFAA